MKTAIFALLVCAGASLAATSAPATPLNPAITSITPDELSSVVQIGNKNYKKYKKHWKGNNYSWKGNNYSNRKHWRRHRWHDDDDDGGNFGIGVLPLIYGMGYYNRPYCDGWWHRHYSGRLHCHWY
jgi:hypothetical protein